MYTRILMHMAVAVVLMSSFATPVNTSENFNSRKGVSLKAIRSSLQNSCWTFRHFDVNQNGWNPLIEGDGAMVSSHSAITSKNAGIYTPLLIISDRIDVSFDYRFNESFSDNTSRWIRICLANSSNSIVKVLEEVELNGSNATKVKNYSSEFTNIHPGEYRLVLLYGGAEGTAIIAIDALATSAPFKFDGGCGIVPVAQELTITGTSDRNATGSLINNNSTSHRLLAFLEKDSPHGNVVISSDGTFVFLPDVGFRGKSTSFQYRVCREDGENLCSLPSSIYLTFPETAHTLLKGYYKYNGNVELIWNKVSNNNIRHFEIERSTDGRSWKRSAVVYENESSNDGYSYTDKVKKNTVLKKDLYYRLRQVENNGSVSITNPMIMRVYNTKSLAMICVAPDAAKRELNLNIQLLENSLVSMRVFDLKNNTVIHTTTEGKTGLNNFAVEGSEKLKPGNYTMEVIVNSRERMLVKLLKE